MAGGTPERSCVCMRAPVGGILLIQPVKSTTEQLISLFFRLLFVPKAVRITVTGWQRLHKQSSLLPPKPALPEILSQLTHPETFK